MLQGSRHFRSFDEKDSGLPEELSGSAREKNAGDGEARAAKVMTVCEVKEF